MARLIDVRGKRLPFWIALAAWACSGIVIASHAVAVRKDFSWVSQHPISIVGSSTARGVGASPSRGWVQQLKRMGYRIESHAVAGSTIFDALEHGCVFAATCLPAGQTPPLLIVQFPSNEIASGRALPEILAAFRKAATWAEARDIPYIFLSIQPRNLDPSKRALLRDLDRQMLIAHPGTYVSLYDALANRDGEIKERYAAGDGVHLNDAGHALIAQETHRHILKFWGHAYHRRD